MSAVVSTVLLCLLGAGLGVPPRIVVSLTGSSHDRVAIRIENAASQKITLSATTYLVLLKAEPPERHSELYWAPLEVRGVPTRAQPLRLAGLAESRVEVDPHSLSWSAERGLSLGRPFRYVVPPGEYEMQIQVLDEEERRWRSGELRVSVSATGSLRL